MDKQLMKMHADTLNVLEAKCLVQLDTTLNQCFIQLNNCVPSSIYSHFKEVFLKSNSESSNGRCLLDKGADQSYKVKHAVQYLKDVNGVFFVLDSATKTCVVARSFSTLSETKLIQQKVGHFVHRDDNRHFDFCAKSATNTDNSSPKRLNCFKCRFRMESARRPSGDCDSISYLNMNCISFLDRFSQDTVVNDKADGSLFIMCIASPAKDLLTSSLHKVPPNQTISSREEIPKPTRFVTVQDVKGNIQEVYLPSDASKKSQTSTLLNNDINRSLKELTSDSAANKGFRQKVLNSGFASCQSDKFRLADGNMARLMTKSQLIVKNPTSRDQVIRSTHFIYREGILKDFNVQGFPKDLCKGIPVPPQTQVSVSNVTTVTMTTSSIATTTSFSSDEFLTSHYVGSTNKNDSFLPDRPPYPVWQRESRASLDATKDFLSGISKSESTIDDLNGVVSPPPHLDGHLVHSVGRPKSNSTLSQLLTSTPGSFHMSRTPSLNSTALPSQSSGVSSVNDFLQNTEPSVGLLSNPGIFPGPPCVDLASCVVTTKGDVTSSAVSSLMSINGLTSMKKEPSTAAAQPHLPPVNSSTMSSTAATVLHSSFSHPRQCATPDKASNVPQSSSPTRPRSASINTSAASSGALKRSSSTLSEDSGIGDLSHANKASPHRLKTKDKLKPFKKHKILSELLTTNNSKDVNIAFTANTSSSSSSSNSTTFNTPSITTMTSTNSRSGLTTTNNSSASSMTSTFSSFVNQTSALPAADVPNRTAVTNSVSDPITSQIGGISRSFLGNVVGTSQPSLSNDLLLENIDEIDEIFDCYQSIIGNSSTQQQQQQQQPSVKANDHIQTFINNTSNNLLSASQDLPMMQQRGPVSSLSSLGTPPSSMLLSPGSNQPIHTLMPSPQSFPPNPVLSPQQNIPRPVSNKNLAFRRIVPTDQETCPNRIVGSRVMASPKTPIRSPAVTQYGTDFGVTESWAGDEPLVDLGAIPPPSGINPRMTIPTQHHMSRQPGISNNMPPSMNQQMSRNPTSARMQFHSPNNIIPTPSMQINMSTAHQQNLNPGLTSSVSPGGFPNTGSPNTFPPMRAPGSSLNSVPRPVYSNMQQQRFSANGNTRARIMQQQIRHNPPPPYQSDVPQIAGGQQFNFNNKQEMSRYMAAQRPNGTVLRPRKPTPIVQRSIPSPVVQSSFNQMNSINNNRFTSNPPGMSQYSSIGSPLVSQQQNQYPNPNFTNDLPSSINFDHGMRPQVIIGSQNPSQFPPNDSFNSMGNTMGPQMGNSFPVEQMNNGPNVMSMGKPQLKRSRSKKATRKKNSPDDVPWVNDDLNNNMFRQRPLMQMTIGNMHQRPQPTYNSPLDGGLQTNRTVMSPQGGGMQTLNLNSLMNQNKNKGYRFNETVNRSYSAQVGFEAGNMSSFHTLPNPTPLQPTPTQNWSDTSMLDDIFEGDSSLRSTGYSLDGLATAESHATMNSNVNNNKAEVISQVRYSGTAAMLPSASGGPLKSPEKGEKKKKPHVILESLLLKED